MEELEIRGTRPRQVRYQAALRPDICCFFILNYFPIPAKSTFEFLRPNFVSNSQNPFNLA